VGMDIIGNYQKFHRYSFGCRIDNLFCGKSLKAIAGSHFPFTSRKNSHMFRLAIKEIRCTQSAINDALGKQKSLDDKKVISRFL
jgi:hypothetical protein